MSDNPNKDHANLPLVVFSALLQTGAGMALASSGAIAAKSPTQSSKPSAPPQLILQPDGSVTAVVSSNSPSIAQTSSINVYSELAAPTTKQNAELSESTRQLIISEDGSICLSETAVEVPEESTAVPVTDERAAVLEGTVDMCVVKEATTEEDTTEPEIVEVEDIGIEEDSMMS